MTDDTKIVFARPWRGSRVIGPHVVRPVHDPVRIRDSIRGVHERVTYQWACKYCDESNAHLASFLTIPSDCNGIEWLDGEELALEQRLQHSDRAPATTSRSGGGLVAAAVGVVVAVAAALALPKTLVLVGLTFIPGVVLAALIVSQSR